MADIDWQDLIQAFFPQGLKLVDPLGHGASSFAMSAIIEKPQFGLQEGVKIAIRVPNEHNEYSIARFNREIELRTRLNNLMAEEILQFYGNGLIQKSKPYIVEELGDQSLYKRLDQIKHGVNVEKFSSAMMDSVIERVAKGLNYLHNLNSEGQGYLHRDVKPANILLVNGAAKLADFGSAGINSSEKKWERDIGKGNSSSGMHGTNNYSAPESLMINGRTYYSIQSDIYSLAITAFNLLTLRTPFDELKLENNSQELYPHKMLAGVHKNFLNDQYDRVIDENPELEYKVNAIRKATLPNPQDRQANIHQFLQEYLTVGNVRKNPLDNYLDSIVEELSKPKDEQTGSTTHEIIYALKDAYRNMSESSSNKNHSKLEEAKKLLTNRWDEDYYALNETMVPHFNSGNTKSDSYYVDKLWKHYGVMKAWGLDIGDGVTTGSEYFLNEADNSNEPLRNCFDQFLKRMRKT